MFLLTRCAILLACQIGISLFQKRPVCLRDFVVKDRLVSANDWWRRLLSSNLSEKSSWVAPSLASSVCRGVIFRWETYRWCRVFTRRSRSQILKVSERYSFMKPFIGGGLLGGRGIVWSKKYFLRRNLAEKFETVSANFCNTK